MLVAFSLNVQWRRNMNRKETKTSSKYCLQVFNNSPIIRSYFLISCCHSMYLLSGSASNIATKINAKLSTIHDKAISWKSCSDESLGSDDSLPWGESSHKNTVWFVRLHLTNILLLSDSWGCADARSRHWYGAR